MMHIELKVGESVRIGMATITLDEKSGKSAKFSIEADKSIPIQRVSHNNREINEQNSTRSRFSG